jgi:predicted ester cyclase
MYRSAVPDIYITIEDQLAEGDKVVTRWRARGTHQGELMGISSSGNRVEVTGITTIDRIEGGRAGGNLGPIRRFRHAAAVGGAS